MAKSLLDTLIDNLFDSIFDDEWKGKYGEKLTARELNLVKLFGRKGKILRNVYLPKDNGETSELDVIFITQKGIFIFESKNYSGWIFGDEKHKNWTASLPNGQKNQFYNPVMQNRTHLKWMQKFVGEDIPLFSIIVFSERCELKKITMDSKDIKVIKRDWTYATVRDIWDKSPDAVSDERVDELFSKLKPLTKVDAAVKAAHVENIEKKYKKPAESEQGPDIQESIREESGLMTKSEHTQSSDSSINIEKIHVPEVLPEEDIKTTIEVVDTVEISEVKGENTDKSIKEALICPRCGSKLVLRTAKKGNNAGNSFYGCSAFPKCRYVRKV